jgi:hypothetical protein
VDRKGQEVQGREHGGEVLFAVAEIVLDIITLGATCKTLWYFLAARCVGDMAEGWRDSACLMRRAAATSGRG